MKIDAVLSYLDKRFPKDLCSDFDIGKVGLSIGCEAIEFQSMMLTLDLTEVVLEEAIANGCNLIISHHPFLFTPLSQIPFDSKIGRILKRMFEKEISLYVMHTNFDCGKGGVNDVLAEMLKLKNIQGEAKKDSFLRYGKISPLKLYDLAEKVKKDWNLEAVRVCGDRDKVISAVGIVGGSGGDIEAIDFALSLGLDCYITGEVKLHIAQYALDHQIAIIEVSHGVEKLALARLKDDLNNKFANRVFLSSINTDPLHYF